MCIHGLSWPFRVNWGITNETRKHNDEEVVALPASIVLTPYLIVEAP